MAEARRWPAGLSKMTVNSNVKAAWRYHNTTKHSYASVHNNLHFLDWANRPLPFKVSNSTRCDPLPLPGEVHQTGVAALSAIAESIHTDSSAIPDLEVLSSEMLYLSAGITRHRKNPGGDIYFRAGARVWVDSTKSSSTLFVEILLIWKQARTTLRPQSSLCADCELETIAVY